MTGEELVPEMHDIGKLLDNEALATATGLPFAHHYFSDRGYRSLNLASVGLPVPSGPTWAAIRYHGGRVLGPRTQLVSPPSEVTAVAGDALADVCLTILADHLAASTSRPVAEEEAREARRQAGNWPTDTSRRHRLWRDDLKQRVLAGPLIDSLSGVRDLLTLVSSQPDTAAFYKRYGHLLDEIPEEKGFPGGVTTLRTHCDLVGRFYRVLRSAVRQTPRGLTYAGNEQSSYGAMEQAWRFRSARCRVRIPAVPARLRDLGIFQRLEAALDSLHIDNYRRDHLLLATYQDIWLFLPLEEIRSLADVLAPLLKAGFHVEAEVREAPLITLTDWKSDEGSPSMTYRYLQPSLQAEVIPPLCEVCQLAPGTARWQRRPDDIPEQLCGTCADTRDQYSQRFERLEDWTEGYAAWLQVSLDFAVLEEHLRRLFEEYISTVGRDVIDAATQERLVASLRTTALTVDYVNDFLAMQEDLAKQLQAVFSNQNVEALTSRRKELLVIRLDNRQDVLKLLQLCHTTALRHLPRSVSQPPFRVAVSIGSVRFPFGEHWRLLQQVRDEITVCFVGGGRLICRLQTVPELLSLARGGGAPRRGLHRLADLAEQSTALARVALADRQERDLAGVAPRLQQLGLDFESMAVFARLTKE